MGGSDLVEIFGITDRERWRLFQIKSGLLRPDGIENTATQIGRGLESGIREAVINDPGFDLAEG